MKKKSFNHCLSGKLAKVSKNLSGFLDWKSKSNFSAGGFFLRDETLTPVRGTAISIGDMCLLLSPHHQNGWWKIISNKKIGYIHLENLNLL
jgi:hypothetical protein